MIQKKGFTMIELVIVIIIISILMLSFRSIFQINNRDLLYAESCINNLYGDVNNYLYSAITSKSLISGNNKTYPEYYSINFITTGNQITLSYSTGSTGANSTIWKNIVISGSNITNYNCKTNGFKIELTGENLHVQIKKGLNEDSSLRSMILNPETNNNPFVGAVRFILLPTGSTGHKEIGRFDIDTRNQSIKSKTCLSLVNTGLCNQRTQ